MFCCCCSLTLEHIGGILDVFFSRPSLSHLTEQMGFYLNQSSCLHKLCNCFLFTHGIHTKHTPRSLFYARSYSDCVLGSLCWALCVVTMWVTYTQYCERLLCRHGRSTKAAAAALLTCCFHNASRAGMSSEQQNQCTSLKSILKSVKICFLWLFLDFTFLFCFWGHYVVHKRYT